MRREMRDADLAANRRDVHDAAAALAAHRRNRRAHRVQWRPEVHRHCLLEVRHIHVVDGPDLNHAGVVDQDVDSAGAGDRLLHELFDFFTLAQVARRDFDLDAAAGEILLRARARRDRGRRS